ncbi:hypothetical protein EK21DRAFT_90159 [Setomelanomma holmii]|uniref:Zn(2)-C6 fungal-type domain-containing protein n=1 Tax=Setomelanomma holmii TaxID=210430 RepID=A0A9P4H8N6_9PLEO|nr:hypothetical protein EK21DRAFT_90159 [Setomelanomma holmii]
MPSVVYDAYRSSSASTSVSKTFAGPSHMTLEARPSASVSCESASNSRAIAASSQAAQDSTTKKGLAACAKCYMHKKKCLETSGPLCSGCEKLSIPQHLCSRVRFAEESVFSKWSNRMYKSQLVWANLKSVPNSSLIVSLCHFLDGPSIDIDCRNYVPTSETQGHLFYKTFTNGWSYLNTTHYCLNTFREQDLEAYISSHVQYFLPQGQFMWLQEVFQQAQQCDDVRTPRTRKL